MNRLRKMCKLVITLCVSIAMVLVTGGIKKAAALSDYETIWANAQKKVYATSTDGITGGNVWKKNLGLDAWSGSESGTAVTTDTVKITNYAGESVDAYVVNNADELRWALVNADAHAAAGVKGIKINKDIDLAGYDKYNWKSVDISSDITIDGNDHTVYNMYINAAREYYNGFLGQVTNENFYCKNLSFSNNDLTWGAVPGLKANDGKGWEKGGNAVFSGSFAAGHMYKIFSKNTEILGGYGTSGLITCPSLIVTPKTMDCCGTENVQIYSKDTGGLGGESCVSSVCEFSNHLTITNTFAIDGTIIAVGGHSGGFTSCNNNLTVKKCFSNVDVYGNKTTGAFIGIIHFGETLVEDCYCSGKIEGNDIIGGFVAGEGAADKITMKNCYSTAMVGMDGGGTNMGSFAGQVNSKFTFTNCYGAGETGSLATSMTDPGSVGGFAGSSDAATYANCYYDKQTTAMREWCVGGSKTTTGITGLLTTDSVKAGSGLASTSAPTFSSDSDWLCKAEQYPQLTSFANAADSDFGGNGAKVRAYSKASVQTALLETYDKKWDGSTNSDTTVYDTVRDITSKFKLSDNGSWNVGTKNADGTYTKQTVSFNNKSYSVLTKKKVSGSDWITDFAPGIEWTRVEATDDSETGFRNMRFVPTVNLDAGKGTSVVVGSTYDHRTTPTMVYTTAADMANKNYLFEGSYNTATNSGTVLNSSAANGIATGHKVHTMVYDIPKNTMNNVTAFTVAQLKAWEQNGTENTSGTAASIDEQYTGLSKMTKSQKGRHLLEYVWELPDGRYVRNAKMVTVMDEPENIAVNVVDDVTSSTPKADSTSAKLGVNQGSDTTVSTSTTASANADINYSGKATVAYKVATNKYNLPTRKLSNASMKVGTDYTEWYDASYSNKTFVSPIHDYSIIKNSTTTNYDVIDDSSSENYTITQSSSDSNLYTIAFSHDDDVDENYKIQLSFEKTYNVIFLNNADDTTPYAANSNLSSGDAYGATPTKNPTSTTHPDYTFIGWNTYPNATASSTTGWYDGTKKIGNEDVIYYAVYQDQHTAGFATITADNARIHSSQAKKVTSADDLKTIMNASATYTDGSAVDASNIKVTTNDLDKIQSGTPGSYNVTFTYTDKNGQSISVMRVLTVYGDPEITAKDTTVDGDKARTLTDKTDLITVMDAIATKSDGTTATPSSVTCKDYDKIKKGVPGKYDVTFTYTDKDTGKTVTTTKTLTVKGNDTITGEDKTIESIKAKTLSSKDDLISLMNAKVTNYAGASEKPTQVICADFANIQKGIAGTYQVTFIYTDPDSGEVVSVTKTLTVTAQPSIVVNTNTTNTTKTTTTGKTNTTKTKTSSSNTKVKTGDATDMTLPLIALCISTLAIIAYVVMKKKTTH